MRLDRVLAAQLERLSAELAGAGAGQGDGEFLTTKDTKEHKGDRDIG
jgi:hypothetical protein